jgi:hypothetical protein
MLARHHRVIKPIRRRHGGNGVDIIVRPAARNAGCRAKWKRRLRRLCLPIDTTMPRDLASDRIAIAIRSQDDSSWNNSMGGRLVLVVETNQ